MHKKKILLSLLASSVLLAEDIKLQEITVTSVTKTEQSIKDVTSNVNVITKEEIEERHYTSVVDALKNVAGINYTSNGGLGATTSIYLRGAGNNRTLILIDGVRYQDPSNTNGASIGHLMMDDIERIEIIKGAQSGIWGADASAGVINIITKSAKKGTHVSGYAEAGSFVSKKFGASASHKTDKFDIKISADRVLSDGFSVQVPKGDDIDDYEDDAYENTTLNLKVGYNITNDARLSFGLTDISAKKEYDSFGNPDDTDMKSDIDQTLYNVKYQQKYQSHNITLKAERSEYEREEIGTVAQWGIEYVKDFDAKQNNLELFDDIKYNEKDFIILGGGLSSDYVEYTLTDSSSHDKTNRDKFVYATNSNIFGNLVLTESLRYDDYNNFDSKTTGKFGVKYNFTNDLYATSNIGTAYNVPNIMQELNPWGGTNRDLNPEDTTSFDISLAYKGFKATYFYNTVDDLIEWYDPDGWGGNPGIYKNLDGESIFKGYEFEYSQYVIDELFITMNYSILSAKDEDGKELARRPRTTFKAGFDYYPNDDFHFGAFGEYIGERFDRADKQGTQTGRYTVVNLVSDYNINKNLSVYAKIDNLFDKYYQVVDGYATAPLSAYVGIKAKF
jgi:vitamin B12 transporter